ncbi:MAG: hypothetical protein ABIH21_04375 [Patescibacteria group bacterium]
MKADLASVLEFCGRLCFNTARWMRVIEAVANREGGMKLPQTITKTLSDKSRDRILAVRDETSDDSWLEGGVRDALCVELGLTPEQVRGVLSGNTRRSNGTSDASSGDQGSLPEPSAPTQPSVVREKTKKRPVKKPMSKQPDARANASAPVSLVSIASVTTDPVSWESRQKVHGRADQPPKQKEYDVDDYDRAVVDAVVANTQKGSPDWKRLMRVIRLKRRLTQQQVAGIVAVMTRQGK